jgi:4'-phosphopantetheinyl transferase
MIRGVLSTYRPVAPEDWRFVSGSHGRPELDPDCGLRFSAAHTRGLTVVGVCDDGEVGVDVERLDRRARPGLAGRWFAPEEVAALDDLAEPQRARRFLELWTLKEAYVKARGLGVIGLPLASFVVDVAGAAGPVLRAAADDDPARCRAGVLASTWSRSPPPAPRRPPSHPSHRARAVMSSPGVADPARCRPP